MGARRWRVGTFVASLAVACVPATNDPNPKGAIGIETLPSPGSRGEPFVTSDGWTITFESLALQLYAVAVPDDGKAGGLGGTYVFSGGQHEEIIIRAIPEGNAQVSLTLVSRPLEKDFEPIYNGPSETMRVSDEVDARFNQPADDSTAVLAREVDSGALTYDTSDGPAVVLSLRAEKAGRIVRLATAISGDQSPHEIPSPVRANDLTTLNLTIAAERLFMKNGVLTFDEIAKADIDNDGVISVSEMRRLDIRPCVRCSPAEKLREEEDAKTRTVLALLGGRVSDLIGAGP